MNALRHLSLFLTACLMVTLAEVRAEDAAELLDQPPSFEADPVTGLMPTETPKPQPEKKPLAPNPVEEKLDKSLEKPLDLSVPFKTGDPVDLPPDNKASPNSSANIFTPTDPKKAQKIRLEGNVIMTHEQEVEKRKSLDGAGISINLKP